MDSSKGLLGKFKLSALFFILLVVPIYVFTTYFTHFDTDSRALFSKFGSVSGYSMNVETVLELPEKTLSISGEYSLNRPKQSYGSVTTTSLGEKEGPTQVFTLTNIAIKNIIYVRIDTEDEALKKTIPTQGSWFHFPSTEVPPQFAQIAVPGPVLDNLLLLTDSGKYLSLIENKGQEAMLGATTTHLVFRLSGKKPRTKGGSLHALLERIGPGSIDVWTNNENPLLVMHFRNGTYRSTTTITSLNSPTITPPKLSEE